VFRNSIYARDNNIWIAAVVIYLLSRAAGFVVITTVNGKHVVGQGLLLLLRNDDVF
jgi:hypothetical protein